MDDAEGFSETARCMESIGIGSEAKEGVFRVSSCCCGAVGILFGAVAFFIIIAAAAAVGRNVA